MMEPTAGKLFGKIGQAMRLAAGMAAQQPALVQVCSRRPMTTATPRAA